MLKVFVFGILACVVGGLVISGIIFGRIWRLWKAFISKPKLQGYPEVRGWFIAGIAEMRQQEVEAINDDTPITQEEMWSSCYSALLKYGFGFNHAIIMRLAHSPLSIKTVGDFIGMLEAQLASEGTKADQPALTKE